MKNKFPAQNKKVNGFDKRFVTLVFSLVIIGAFMIYNSTVIYSQQIYGNAYTFVKLHLGWVAVGTLCFIFFLNFDYHKLRIFSYMFYGLALFFLLSLAIFGLFPCDKSVNFAPCINGANRWLYLNPPPLPELPLLGVLGFQPSEFAKMALIIYLAFQLTRNIERKENPFVVFIGVSLLTAGLIIMQPNMSTAIIVFLICSLIYFVSGASLKPFVYLVPTFLLLAILFVVSSPYRRDRLFTLIGSNDNADLSTSYHINQISIALGSGGIFGLGFGQSRQKYQYLPEVASDSIFAIIGEEFGFIGTTLLMLLFIYFIYMGIKIAKNAPDLLGKLLASGMIAWIGIQFVVNAAAMSKLIPLTGVPIPLISYGGSSLVFSMVGLGIVANISKFANS